MKKIVFGLSLLLLTIGCSTDDNRVEELAPVEAAPEETTPDPYYLCGCNFRTIKIEWARGGAKDTISDETRYYQNYKDAPTYVNMIGVLQPIQCGQIKKDEHSTDYNSVIVIRDTK